MSSVVSLAAYRKEKEAEKAKDEAQHYVPRHQSDYSSFNPRQYVAEYYQEIGLENRFLLEFYHRVFQQIPSSSSLLEFGGGPTIYQLLSARKKASEIVFAEFLVKNREEIRKWIRRDKEAINWDRYLNAVLALEKKKVSETNRLRIREELEPKVTQIIECDAFSPEILGRLSHRQFDVVSSGFCLECISPEEKYFQEFLVKLTAVLRQGGTLILTMLKRAENYKVGDLTFPAFSLDEQYMRAALRRLKYHWISTETIPAESDQGYQGIIAITAEKG